MPLYSRLTLVGASPLYVTWVTLVLSIVCRRCILLISLVLTREIQALTPGWTLTSCCRVSLSLVLWKGAWSIFSRLYNLGLPSPLFGLRWAPTTPLTNICRIKSPVDLRLSCLETATTGRSSLSIGKYRL